MHPIRLTLAVLAALAFAVACKQQPQVDAPDLPPDTFTDDAQAPAQDVTPTDAPVEVSAATDATLIALD
jgi:hypothetical protein